MSKDNPLIERKVQDLGDDRLIERCQSDEDVVLNLSLRPLTLDEFIGEAKQANLWCSLS